MRWIFLAIALLCSPASAQLTATGVGSGGFGVAAGGLGLQTNLSAFWAFASQPSVDSTANGNNLSTGAGTPGTTSGPGSNSAVSYNGSSSNKIVNNTSLQLGTNFSINFWVNSTGANNDGIFLSKDDGGFGNWDWYFGPNFNGSANVYSFVMYSAGTSTKICDSIVTVTPGLTMVSGTWDGTNQRIYINGALSATCAQTAVFTGQSSAIFVGQDGGGGSGAFMTGSVALVGLWKNRVLNLTDVANLYNAGNGLSFAGML